MEAALIAVRSAWRGLLEKAAQAKKQFQDDANQCMAFFNGPYDFLYGSDANQSAFVTGISGADTGTGKKRLSPPAIGITINKVAEGVQLFGPTLYHRNPVRRVTQRLLPEIPSDLFGDPKDPRTQAIAQSMMAQMGQYQQSDKMRASIMESLLNYLPLATGLKDEMRDSIDEAIIKGAGVSWTSVFRPIGSNTKLVRTTYDTVDNLMIDPDHELMADAKWCARRCIEPTWQVEAERGLAPGSLRGTDASQSAASGLEVFGDEWKKKDGKTNDLLVYWKIWSKMGLGGLLRGIDESVAQVDRFGRFVYLEVSETVNYPLNMPPAIWGNEAELYRRVQWETPFWADTDSWPFTFLAFHRVPRRIWPMSHFRPAMGELKFLNWAYSFLASRMHTSSRTFVGILKAASEELKRKVLEGTDFELLELEASLGADIGKLIQFIDHPEVKGDFIKIIEMVEKQFEKRTGLNELLYGETSHQYRSAAEADAKQANLNIRPDDMGNKVEDFATNIARKEALAARWHMSAEDIAPIFGPVVANFWKQYVASADINAIVRQLEYRVEAGSTRKPNKQKDAADANEAMRTLFPILSQVAESGNVAPCNTLIKYWGKALSIDVSGMLLPEPPPASPHPDQPKVSVSLDADALSAFGLVPQIQEIFGAKPVGQVAPLPDNDGGQQLEQDEDEHQQSMRHAAEKHKLAMKIQKQKAKQSKESK